MHRVLRIVASLLLHGVSTVLICLAIFLFLIGGLLISGISSVDRAVAELEGLALSAVCGALFYFVRKIALQVWPSAEEDRAVQKIQPPPTTSSPS